MNEEFQKQVLDEIKKVDDHIAVIEEKAEEQAKLNGEVQEETKKELEKWSETYTKLKERLDHLETESKRLGQGVEAKKSFGEKLTEAITENHEAIKNAKSGGASIEIKDAITMTQGDSLIGEVIPPTRVPGIFHDPDRQTHVRQFLQSATTDSNNIRFVVEESYEDGTDVTGEGSTKPQSSFKLEAKDAPVRKIATHLKVSDEMLEDVAGLAGYISTRGTTKYRLKEDQQLLYGTGAGNQIRGLALEAAAFSKKLTQPLDNLYDVAIDAQAQLAARHYIPSAIMLNPVDWLDLLITKASDGHYVINDLIRQGLAPAQLNSVPVIQNTAITEGDFFSANFAQMATLYDRRSVSVRFFEQNEDDAINNLITVVIEGRLALPIYLPNAGVYGDLADIIES
jgi:HK97 family phage major capsid protein